LFVAGSGGGTVYTADAAVTGFERHSSDDVHARFIDFDGQVQAAPDITTHGVLTSKGERVYVDVYPALAVPSLGAALHGPGQGGDPGNRPPTQGTGSGDGSGDAGGLAATGAAFGWPLVSLAALTLVVLGGRRAVRR
jgi:hypothetical protein